MKKIKNILILALTCVLLSTTSKSQATCGGINYVYNPPGATSLPTEFEIRDRLGNLYNEEDLTYVKTSGAAAAGTLGIASNVTNKYVEGMFTLHFVDEPSSAGSGFGFDDSDNRDLVRQVFRDINVMLTDVNPSNSGRVNIFFVSDQSIGDVLPNSTVPSGVAGFATGFSTVHNSIKHSIIDNVVYNTIRGGSDAYENLPTSLVPMNTDNGIFHGYTAINFSGFSWNNDHTAVTINSSDLDLYTVVLHETIHMLGFGSLIAQGGNSKINSNNYARYDDYLYKTNSTAANKAVIYDNAAKTFISSFSNYALGCTSPDDFLFSGNSTTNQSVYTDNSWSDGSNLSHFPCSGSGGGGCAAYSSNGYVMSPCVGMGSNFIKRRPQDNEHSALCDMGYEMTTTYGDDPANTTIYKNNYVTCNPPCIAIGKHDYFYTGHLQAITKTYSTDVLNNDYPASGNKVGRIELLDPTKGTLSLTGVTTANPNGTGFSFTPNVGTVGEVFIAYYPQCSNSSKIGSITYITINVAPPPLPACIDKGECNLICSGSFEESQSYLNWSNFLVSTSGDNSSDLYETVGGVTCRWANSSFKHMCNVGYLTCGLNTLTGVIGVAPNNGKQYISMVNNRPHNNHMEAINFKLRRPLIAGKQYKLAFVGRKVANSCSKFKVIVHGDDKSPCLPPSITLLDGTTSSCGFKALQLHTTASSPWVNSTTWTEYELNLTTTRSITDIIVHIEYDHANYTQAFSALDGFSLVEVGANSIEVTTTANLNPCIDNTSKQITYEIKWPATASTSSNNTPITLQLDMPTGVSFESGTGTALNANGEHIIPVNSLDKVNSYTLVVNYSLDPGVINGGQSYDILLKGISNACISANSNNKITLVPVENPLTITKSVSNANPSLNDNVTYTIEVCNKSFSPITGVLVKDLISPNLSIVNLNGFNHNGNELSRTITVPPATSQTSLGCISVNFVAKVLSVCPIENCATISKSTVACLKGEDCVTINQGSFPLVSISPSNGKICAQGNRSLVLTANLNPTVTGASYTWYKDGVLIAGANAATYTATDIGDYEVVVNYNGCDLKASTKLTLLEIGAVGNKTDPYCPATPTTGGVISVNAYGGQEPYTFAWADGFTGQNRTGLPEGMYSVTIMDTNGCTKTLDFTLRYK